jgi:hypothetical protein
MAETTPDVTAVLARLDALEARLRRTEQGLAEAQAVAGMLNDRLAWAEADLAATALPAAVTDPGMRRPHPEPRAHAPRKAGVQIA